mgnify:CR=1 FL=1
MLKVSEVYEKQIRTMNERPDGTEYASFDTVFDTRECLINRNYIVSVHSHEFKTSLASKKAEDSFPEGTKFSTLVLDGNSFRQSEMVVLGSFSKFCQELQTV